MINTGIAAQIQNLISRPETAFLAGVLAVITPCVVVLIPIFLYRFGIWGEPVEGRNWRTTAKELAFLVSGFLISFAIAGLALESLTNSQYVNVTRLILGLGLILTGSLLLSGSLRFNLVNRFSHPFLVGGTLPWIISFSPCVLPFLSLTLTSASSNTGSALLKFVLFGIGILTPPIVIALLGNWILHHIKRASGWLVGLERISPIFLIISGFILILEIVNLTKWDIYVTNGFFVIVFFSVSVYILRDRANRSLTNLVYLIIYWMILGYVVNNLPNLVTNTNILSSDQFLFACAEGAERSPQYFQSVLVYLGLSTMIWWWLAVYKRPSASGRIS